MKRDTGSVFFWLPVFWPKGQGMRQMISHKVLETNSSNSKSSEHAKDKFILQKEVLNLYRCTRIYAILVEKLVLHPRMLQNFVDAQA